MNWNAIFERAAPSARLLLRSAHANPPFLDWVTAGPQHKPLKEMLNYETELAARLQSDDRVHTYAGFAIAQVVEHAGA